MADSSSSSGSLFLNRKLTADESTELQQLLRRNMTSSGGDDFEEDIREMIEYTTVMVSNQKTVDYMVQEIISLQLEFCPPETAHALGKTLESYLRNKQSSSENNLNGTEIGNNNHPADHGSVPTADTATKSTTTSTTKQRHNNNALTMSGALSASREGRSKEKTTTTTKASGTNITTPRKGRSNNMNNNNPGDSSSNRNNPAAAGGRGGRGGRENRRHSDAPDRTFDRNTNNDRHSRAFDRLTTTTRRNPRNDNNDHQSNSFLGRGGGRGRGVPDLRRNSHDDDRRSGGRSPERRDVGRGGGARGGRGGGRRREGDEEEMQHGRRRPTPPTDEFYRSKNDNVSGQRRFREEVEEEEDFISATGPKTPGGRGGGRGRITPGGRPPNGDRQREIGGRFAGGQTESANKRQRIDINDDEQYTDEAADQEYGNEGYDHDGEGGGEGYYNYFPTRGWRGGYRGGGGRLPGRGFYPGRGRGARGYTTPVALNQNETITEGGGDDDATGNPVPEGAYAVHPSPIVAANYYGGGRASYSYSRGRGRGPGRGFPGRVEVVKSLIASKTWVRQKDEADEGGGGTVEGQAGPSTEADA